MVAVVAFATRPWSRVLSRIIPYPWLSVVVGVVLSIASLWLIYSLIDALTTGKLRRGACPNCGAKLVETGRGFYDGIVPEPWEAIIYLVVIALPYVVAAAMRFGA